MRGVNHLSSVGLPSVTTLTSNKSVLKLFCVPVYSFQHLGTVLKVVLRFSSSQHSPRCFLAFHDTSATADYRLD